MNALLEKRRFINMWFDNVGFELNPDDYVLCLSGDYAYTVQQIRKLS